MVRLPGIAGRLKGCLQKVWAVGLSVLLVATVLLPALPVQAASPNWTIDGNKVYTDDSNVYLSATPHTLGSSGWVEFELLSKNYSGEVDVGWGFTGSDGKVTRLQVWRNTAHSVYKWVNVLKSYTVHNITEYEFGYVIPEDNPYPVYGNEPYTDIAFLRCNEFPGGVIVKYDSYSGNLSAMTINYYQYEQREFTEWYDDWDNVGRTPSTAYIQIEETNRWQVIYLDFSTTAGVLYKARAWVEIPFAGKNKVTGKYFFGVKPHGETLEEAKQKGHLYYLDPWWDSGWAYRNVLSFDTTGIDFNFTDYPVIIHLHPGNNFDFAKAQANGEDIRFIDKDDVTELPYLITSWDSVAEEAWIVVRVPQIDAGSNYSDYICVYYGNPEASDGQSSLADVTGTDDTDVVLNSPLYAVNPGDLQLLTNSSFETGNPPTDWTLTGAGATWERSTEQVKYGTYSGKLTRAGADAYAEWTLANPTAYQSKVMTAKVWVYATVASRARLQLVDSVGNTYSSYHTGDSTWQLLSVTRTIDAAATAVSVRLHVDTGDTSAYFDEAVFHENYTWTSPDTYGHVLTEYVSIWDNGWSFGWTPQGRAFNGIDNKITMTLSFGKTATLSCWAGQIPTVDKSQALMASGSSYQNGINVNSLTRNAQFRGASSVGAKGIDIYLPVGFSFSTFHLYTGVSIEGVGLYLYVDGDLVGSNTTDYTETTFSGTYYLGSAANYANRFLEGKEGEVLISTQALSQAEIEQIAQATKWRHDTTKIYYGAEDPPPTLSTLSATNVYMDGGTHATLRGELESLGGAPTCDIWFEWGYNTSYGNTVGSQTVTSTGTYTYNLTGYDPDRTVHYRFVGENVDGTTYGGDASFKVSGSVPGVYRLAAITPYIFVGIAILLVLGCIAVGGPLIPALIIAVILSIVGIVGVSVIQGVLRAMW